MSQMIRDRGAVIMRAGAFLFRDLKEMYRDKSCFFLLSVRDIIPVIMPLRINVMPTDMDTVSQSGVSSMFFSMETLDFHD